MKNRSLWINEHESHNREEEYDREHDGDAVEVLLNDARSALRRIERAGDHIGNARPLAGMQQDEDDEAGPGNHQEDQQYYKQRVHIILHVRLLRLLASYELYVKLVN